MGQHGEIDEIFPTENSRQQTRRSAFGHPAIFGRLSGMGSVDSDAVVRRVPVDSVPIAGRHIFHALRRKSDDFSNDG